MKQIIILTYVWYNKYFPIQRGKAFIGKCLAKILGKVLINIDGQYLEILPNSSMDLSYFGGYDNSSHKVIIEEINKLKEGAVFADIGANIGYFTFVASKKIGPLGLVYAFEPSIREYQRLLSGILKNSFTNIIPFNIALGDNQGIVTFNLSSDSHTGLNSIISKTPQSINVNVFLSKLDDIYTNNRIIDLVKLDVEGYEMAVLLGMKKLFESKVIKKLIIEITPHLLTSSGYSKEFLYEYLSLYGYKSSYNLQDWQYDEVFTLEEI